MVASLALINALACPVAPSTTVVLLNQTGCTWTGCAGSLDPADIYAPVMQWEETFWSWMASVDERVTPQWIQSSELVACSASEIAHVLAINVPGGDSYTHQKVLGAEGKQLLLDYLANGPNKNVHLTNLRKLQVHLYDGVNPFS